MTNPSTLEGVRAAPIPLRPELVCIAIRQRAYELCQERGEVDGNPTDDWWRAKREVLSRKA
jgi:hypothetical protein